MKSFQLVAGLKYGRHRQEMKSNLLITKRLVEIFVLTQVLRKIVDESEHKVEGIVQIER